MANREEVTLLMSARAGDTTAQIALAKRYLFGGTSLPKSTTTSLYWLLRAAQCGVSEAWMLIGEHIPFEVALPVPDRHAVCQCYERAYDSGLIHAGLVLARLVLTLPDYRHTAPMRCKAWQALEHAAEFGMAEAQWLLAQQIELREIAVNRHDQTATTGRHLEWARRAAENGVLQARHMLADHAWRADDERAYLYWARPLAHSLVTSSNKAESIAGHITAADTLLLSRCARTLYRAGAVDDASVAQFAEMAARAGEKRAQFYLGLWFAKMDENGKRVAAAGRLVNYRKALHWLTLAGDQGLADAWYIAAQIKLIPQFADRKVADAERYLVLAADGGHRHAQLELAQRLWRKRADVEGNDVQAVYWLQKAAAQGCAEAATALRKYAATAVPARWAATALCTVDAKLEPFIAARLMLAASFGLTERETLLLDVARTDRGHCLEVVFADGSAREKRRLILLQTAAERQLLDQVKTVFEGIDCGPNGPEGSYRQRLYRLRRTLMRLSDGYASQTLCRQQRTPRVQRRFCNGLHPVA